MGLYTKRETWSWSERSRLTIRPELATDTEILQRFKQELILARLVSDRTVIRISRFGRSGKIKFIPMEYVECESLHSIIRQRGTQALS